MKTILIVEDDEKILNLYTKLLKLNGYEVHTAVTGSEGFEAVKNSPPDLILLDIMFPTGKMNGFDVLEQLKRNPDFSHIPVIMMTNLDGEEKTAKDIGANDYIIKANISIDEMLAKVKLYLQ